MTQYNTLNAKFFKSQVDELKCGIKNGTEVTLKHLSNVVGDSNDENDFSHKFLLTNTHVLRLRKAFPNSLPANVKLSKSQLHKIGKSRGFLDRAIAKNWSTFNEKST